MIKLAQIDPFGYCNAKCWYCPNKYYQQPKRLTQHMPIRAFEHIIKSLCDSKGSIVDPGFDFVYVSHYNEIILYRHFAEMLEVLKKYRLKTMILSNGIAFNEDVISAIRANLDAIGGINFNTPSFDNVEWAVDTGCKESLAPFENIKKAFHEFGNTVSVGVNGVEAGKVNARVSYARKVIPEMNIYPAVGLCDRAGLLHDKGIISNREEIDRNKSNKTKIIGCKNSNRFDEWLHINSLGEVFLCCQDYFCEYPIGTFFSQSLKDIWSGQGRQDTINRGKKEICQRCSFAVWGD
jgi:MoaA/NifB/PqqE/SkfB family radical SAM enzyme